MHHRLLALMQTFHSNARGNPVTLLDGRVVDSYSEEWRAECEARYICNLPTLPRRRQMLADIERIRGKAAADKVRANVAAVWQAKK